MRDENIPVLTKISRRCLVKQVLDYRYLSAPARNLAFGHNGREPACNVRTMGCSDPTRDFPLQALEPRRCKLRQRESQSGAEEEPQVGSTHQATPGGTVPVHADEIPFMDLVCDQRRAIEFAPEQMISAVAREKNPGRVLPH